jgi:hypothetical protein
MSDYEPPVVSVTGGAGHASSNAGSIEARCDDMQTTAGLIGALAEDMAMLALGGHRYLADADVLASAALDPVGSGRFESAMAQALDGVGGLTTIAVGIGVSAVKLEVAAVLYRAADELSASFVHAVRFTVALPDALLETGGHILHGETPWDAIGHTLADHPGLMEDLVGGVPALLAGLGTVNPVALGAWAALGFPTTVQDGAARLAWLYPDGEPRVTRHAGDTDPVLGHHGDLRDLMAVLGHRDRKAGEIDVRVILGPDGKPQSVIVDIPGTKAWNLLGLQRDKLQDWITNIHAAGNDTTAYERAVRQALDDALDQAGVPDRAHLPVMLVGHSQGGAVALHAAGGMGGSDRYSVTHVLAAGANGSNVTVPSSVQVLAIENLHDIVPRTDGRANPADANWTTLTVDAPNTHSVTGNHGINQVYLGAAGTADSSFDPSVRAYRDGAGAFLNNYRVETYVYDVSRR